MIDPRKTPGGAGAVAVGGAERADRGDALRRVPDVSVRRSAGDRTLRGSPACAARSRQRPSARAAGALGGGGGGRRGSRPSSGRRSFGFWPSRGRERGWWRWRRRWTTGARRLRPMTRRLPGGAMVIDGDTVRLVCPGDGMRPGADRRLRRAGALLAALRRGGGGGGGARRQVSALDLGRHATSTEVASSAARPLRPALVDMRLRDGERVAERHGRERGTGGATRAAARRAGAREGA